MRDSAKLQFKAMNLVESRAEFGGNVMDAMGVRVGAGAEGEGSVIVETRNMNIVNAEVVDTEVVVAITLALARGAFVHIHGKEKCAEAVIEHCLVKETVEGGSLGGLWVVPSDGNVHPWVARIPVNTIAMGHI